MGMNCNAGEYIFFCIIILYSICFNDGGNGFCLSERENLISWMNNSVGPRYAFIGTFMWFLLMCDMDGELLRRSHGCTFRPAFVFGADAARRWRIAGRLEPTQVVGGCSRRRLDDSGVPAVASGGINKVRVLLRR